MVGGLPADRGEQLVDAAFAAFTTAVQAGYGFAAAVLAPVDLAVIWLPRRVRPDATEEDTTEEGPAEEGATGADAAPAHC